jgi:hypothetical protein
MIDPQLQDWLDKGKYIPREIQEPGLQAAIFECLEQELAADFPPGSEYAQMMQAEPWKRDMVFSLDYFLRLMAMHGYTLQRTWKPFQFQQLSKSFIPVPPASGLPEGQEVKSA